MIYPFFVEPTPSAKLATTAAVRDSLNGIVDLLLSCSLHIAGCTTSDNKDRHMD